MIITDYSILCQAHIYKGRDFHVGKEALFPTPFLGFSHFLRPNEHWTTPHQVIENSSHQYQLINGLNKWKIWIYDSKFDVALLFKHNFYYNIFPSILYLGFPVHSMCTCICKLEIRFILSLSIMTLCSFGLLYFRVLKSTRF